MDESGGITLLWLPYSQRKLRVTSVARKLYMFTALLSRKWWGNHTAPISSPLTVRYGTIELPRDLLSWKGKIDVHPICSTKRPSKHIQVSKKGNPAIEEKFVLARWLEVVSMPQSTRKRTIYSFGARKGSCSTTNWWKKKEENKGARCLRQRYLS